MKRRRIGALLAVLLGALALAAASAAAQPSQAKHRSPGPQILIAGEVLKLR